MNPEIITLIIKKKKSIISFVVFIMMIAFIYFSLSTPLYKSYVTIYPSESESNLSSMSDFGSMVSQFQNLGMSSSRLGATTYHIKDLVESSSLKYDIIKNNWETNKDKKPINLIKYWELNEELYSGFIHKIKKKLFSIITTDLNEIRLDEAKTILETRIEVIEEESGLFIINVLMEEPKLSSDIANYIASYIQNYISTKSTDKANKNRNFIEDRLTLAKNDLKASETLLIGFIKKNQTMDTPEVQFENLRLTRNLEINQELYLTILKEFEISKIEELKELEIVNILDSAKPDIKKTKPNILLMMIIIFNFSFICIVSFYFINENYFKKIFKNL